MEGREEGGQLASRCAQFLSEKAGSSGTLPGLGHWGGWRVHSPALGCSLPSSASIIVTVLRHHQVSSMTEKRALRQEARAAHQQPGQALRTAEHNSPVPFPLYPQSLGQGDCCKPGGFAQVGRLGCARTSLGCSHNRLFFPTHRPWDTMTKYLHTRCAVPPSPACQRMGRACHWGVKQYQVLPAGTTAQLPPSSWEAAGARPGMYKHRPAPSTHARAGAHPEHAQMNPSLQLCPGVGTSACFMCSSAAGKTAPSAS